MSTVSPDQNSISPEILEALLPPDYEPSDSEDKRFMSPLQRAYYYKKLKTWRSSILEDSENTLETLRNGRQEIEDEIDTAFFENDQALELRARDRQRKLLLKIEQAMSRVLNGTYGFCKMTGEPIELQRLNARPVAEFSIEGQELHERKERMAKKAGK
ncbi:MAG: RNA polymerase-binding protein DksA [Alphaproteobacteria bacterium]|nr:RNA polymerase-binding protein DksA [Alphaproteobacteria bacterium]